MLPPGCHCCNGLRRERQPGLQALHQRAGSQRVNESGTCWAADAVFSSSTGPAGRGVCRRRRPRSCSNASPSPSPLAVPPTQGQPAWAVPSTAPMTEDSEVQRYQCPHPGCKRSFRDFWRCAAGAVAITAAAGFPSNLCPPFLSHLSHPGLAHMRRPQAARPRGCHDTHGAVPAGGWACRLKVHYRAEPLARGSGVERGHGLELPTCPLCKADLTHVR